MCVCVCVCVCVQVLMNVIVIDLRMWVGVEFMWMYVNVRLIIGRGWIHIYILYLKKCERLLYVCECMWMNVGECSCLYSNIYINIWKYNCLIYSKLYNIFRIISYSDCIVEVVYRSRSVQPNTDWLIEIFEIYYWMIVSSYL